MCLCRCCGILPELSKTKHSPCMPVYYCVSITLTTSVINQLHPRFKIAFYCFTSSPYLPPFVLSLFFLSHHSMMPQVGARLISHAGSLTSLAKYPASTVQILGAEKALFRSVVIGFEFRCKCILQSIVVCTCALHFCTLLNE